jgi:hypothetical protein
MSKERAEFIVIEAKGMTIGTVHFGRDGWEDENLNHINVNIMPHLYGHKYRINEIHLMDSGQIYIGLDKVIK